MARHARELVGADLATVALPEARGDTLVLEVAEGPVASALIGYRFPRAGSVSGTVLETGRAAVLEEASLDYRIAQPHTSAGELGPSVFVALVADGQPFGTLSVARVAGAAPFTADDLEMVRSFAAQAGVALEQDRSRHATARLVTDRHAQQRLAALVDDLDVTVRQIRTVIFHMELPAPGRDSGLRSKVLDLTQELGPVLGFDSRVTFAGLVDTSVSEPLAEEVLATLRETLSNAARHAQARHVGIELTVTNSDVIVRVNDDGVGFPAEKAWAGDGNGLRNMRTRAERLGGSFKIGTQSGGGTVVDWQAPLSSR